MQHYTRNTVQAEAWCSKCHKMTAHRVDAPKLGPCLDCLERLQNPMLPCIGAEPEQQELFGEQREATA